VSGADRRFRGEKRGVIVMDDFAHHPTAVKETLNAVKSHFCKQSGSLPFLNHEPIQACARCFSKTIPLCSIQRIESASVSHLCLKKFPKGNAFPVRRLVADLNDQGKNAAHFDDTESIIDDLAESSIQWRYNPNYVQRWVRQYSRAVDRGTVNQYCRPCHPSASVFGKP
jgi:UDP-N-acetylmuramate: L-alanyl-gamma-D-glutamyl-meso-diaminopimelate ligase